MENKIIYYYPNYASFVKKDIEILEKKYKVIHTKHNWTAKKWLPITFIQQFLFLLFKVPKSKCIFVMFGGYWSLLPTLFGKIFRIPVFIILGGTDAVSFPKLNYGSLRKPILKAFIGRSYRWATALLPVSDKLIRSTNHYFQSATFKEQGVQYFFPNMDTHFSTIYNGFNVEKFQSDGSLKVANSFVCIASIHNEMRFKLKGIDLMLALAKELPDCTFTVIGMQAKMHQKLLNVPTNFIVKEFLQPSDFIQILSKSEYYMQLSISEGFPNSLCEGMLCECIPIGSNVGAIPEIIGDTGVIIERDDLQEVKIELLQLMRKSKAEKIHLSKIARKRVLENFNIERRAQALYAIIDAYTK